jgi:sec-independent protein translocase protein TatA
MGGAISPIHIIIVVVILVLLFGATRLPKMGRDLGEGLRGFKDGIMGHEDEAGAAKKVDAAAPKTDEK